MLIGIDPPVTGKEFTANAMQRNFRALKEKMGKLEVEKESVNGVAVVAS